ncbi:MAG: hypothetical protein AB2556_26470 [Candidatus Thiodiazotropha sp.]
MDDLIDEILAEMPNPVPDGQLFTDLDDQVPPQARLPADQWVEILNDVKDEFEVDGAVAIFSSWRKKTHLTSVISRSLMVFMSEEADWL